MNISHYNIFKELRGRHYLSATSFVEWKVSAIRPDRWRRHGVKYRLAYIVGGRCRLLFDNHKGKKDHYHLDGKEYDYNFVDVTTLRRDFEKMLIKLGVNYENKNI